MSIGLQRTPTNLPPTALKPTDTLPRPGSRLESRGTPYRPPFVFEPMSSCPLRRVIRKRSRLGRGLAPVTRVRALAFVSGPLVGDASVAVPTSLPRSAF